MARVDYEAAWNDLAALIATHEGQGWGTDTLLAEMTKIAVRHQIPEDFIEKAARLYGVLPQAHTQPATTADTGGGATPPDGKPEPGTSKVERNRDERDRSAAGPRTALPV